MTNISSLCKVFKAWGKDVNPEAFFTKYWTYIADAIDGLWGTTQTDQLVVHYIGKVCFWNTKSFVADTSLKRFDIPVKTNEIYPIKVFNLTNGMVSCAFVSDNYANISLTIGNTYQISSELFIYKN